MIAEPAGHGQRRYKSSIPHAHWHKREKSRTSRAVSRMPSPIR